MAKAKKLASGSWRCQVYSHTEELTQSDGTIKKKRIYKSFTCDDPTAKGRRKCEAEAAEWAANKEKRSLKGVSKTFAEELDDYIEGRRPVLSPSTIRGYKNIQTVLTRDFPAFVSKRTDVLTNNDVQNVINAVSAKKSPKTVRNYHGLISAVIGGNLKLETVLPQKVVPELYIPTDEEVRLLLSAVANTELEIPVMLGAFCMMRRGEICGLSIHDLSKNNILHIHHSKVMGDDSKMHVKAPKTVTSDRYIEIPSFIANKIREKGYITTLHPDTISSTLPDIQAKIGLPRFRFHDLRHYSASVMHALGVPDAYIMERGGWGSDKVLKSIYRHALTDRQKEMNKKTNDYFTKLCNTKCNTK